MALLFFGILLGMGIVFGGAVWMLYAGGISREGIARILNGIAIGLMQGKKKPPASPLPPEPPPAAIPVRLLPPPIAELIDIPPPSQGPGRVLARPNLLEPGAVNHPTDEEMHPGRGPKRQRRAPQ